MNIDVYDLVKILVGIICALCVYILLREINRISKQGSRIAVLEKDALELKSRVIDRTELKVELAELSVERMRLHQENKEKLDEILQTTKGIQDHAVEIRGLQVRLTAAEGSITDLRYWKHHTVDPYIPAVFKDHERRLQNVEKQA